ncbi:hypothetical protein [Sinorhizobium medicae]|uniref:Uncharacterized protein n=1 Tax=Sinorhizobium medicae TaxID=110321 RepID=A0A508WRH8_9HYPH|nr:hypothetical protein [Sinorhizobium medicae]MDX0524825.1 hypothetical protein [Sinorhizobium medicae]VTZ60115.1 conserved hypothetical protein [Sinorhizobium medicae]
MADSENSRTSPAITRSEENFENGALENLPHVINRRNLLPVAARALSARFDETRDQQRPSGPRPVKEMWPRWYACHLQRVRATRLRQKLETKLLGETGGAPIVELRIGTEQIVPVHSFADINRLAPKLDAEQLSQARVELSRRRKRWKEADQRLGYAAAVAQEQELAHQAGIAGRVMRITAPSSVAEVTAKLHCLIVMQDPGLKLELTPWPELRRLLRDLIRMEDRAGETRDSNSSREAC